ncbi:MAG: LLM class flavin-dependent oxidoreductase [Nitrososphaerales archaeon]
MSVQIGVFLPTFGGARRRSGEEIAAFARRAEDLGFDSLWATDHLLHGSLFYRHPWLDPMLALTYAAGVTRRVRLGTSILVMPTRQPLNLAKEISTLQALSEDRFILGAGTGWDDREFEAAGIEKSERGSRTDECLELVRELLSGKAVNFTGKHYRMHEVEIGPAPKESVVVWVAGGSQLAHPDSPEPPALAERVLRRIGKADGWIARPTALPQQIASDREQILAHRRAGGREEDGFTVAHENFLHLVATSDPAVARDEQRAYFEEVMGHGRPFDYFDQVYLTGTEEEVLEKLRARRAAGVTYFMLHTLEPSISQLELWASRLIPQLREME